MMKRLPFNVLVAAAMAVTVTTSQSADLIALQIDSKDATQIQQAVTNILNQLHEASVAVRTNTVHGLAQRGHWLEKLKLAQQHEEVVRLAQEATLTVPWDVWLAEYVQEYRVRALLKLGRPQEALAAAKSLLNVGRMKKVADEVSLIFDCLKAAYPGDDAILDRFRQEQVAGATLSQSSTVSNQLSVIGLRSSVLDGITVDPTPYEAAIQQYSAGTDCQSLTALGNLLLLADRPKEARAAFEKAYALASDGDLKVATESIARCAKAEDGTIGRANAWLLSIKP